MVKTAAPRASVAVKGMTCLLSPNELAAILGIAVATIYQWRYRGEGPRGIRVGGKLRFDPADVRAWVDANKAASSRG